MAGGSLAERGSGLFAYGTFCMLHGTGSTGQRCQKPRFDSWVHLTLYWTAAEMLGCAVLNSYDYGADGLS